MRIHTKSDKPAADTKEDNFLNNLISTKGIIGVLQTDPYFRDDHLLKNIEEIITRYPFNQYLFDLNDAQLRSVAKRIRVMQIPPNKLFISKGTMVERFYILIEGYASVNYGVMANNQIKYIFPGESIGQQSLLFNQQAQYNAYTGKDGCVLAYLEREDFNQNVKANEMARIQRHLSFLKSVDLLKYFSEEQIMQFYFASNAVNFPSNQYIYQQGTKSSGFYIVLDGSVQILIKKIEKDDLSVNYDGSIISKKDSFAKLKEVQQGEFFGHYELLQRQDARVQSAYSNSEKTHLLYLTNGIFWRFFTNSPNDRGFQILKSLVKYEEVIMKNQGGSSSSSDLSPKRSHQMKIMDKIKPLDLGILKIKTPTNPIKSDSTPRLYDTKFINMVYQQGYSPLTFKFINKSQNQHSPLSAFRNIVKSEAKLINSIRNQDSNNNTQTFGIETQRAQEQVKEKEGNTETKKNGSNGNDVSTITPFSYDEDYFKKLEKQEEDKNQSSTQSEEKPSNANIKQNEEGSDTNIVPISNTSSQIEKLNILDDSETEEIKLPSSPYAKKLRNKVLKQQTLTDTTDETHLISDFQLNYLKESQHKFSTNIISDKTITSSINLVFNNETLQKKKVQSKKSIDFDKIDIAAASDDKSRRSKSLTTIRQKIKNYSPSPITIAQYHETQPKFLSPKYKLLSAVSPLTNSQLIKATVPKNEESNANTVTMSPSLKISLNRPASPTKTSHMNTQASFHQRYQSVIKISSDCTHIGHKRALSQIFYQQKQEQNKSNLSNLNKDEPSILNRTAHQQQGSFAQKFIIKMQQNTQELQKKNEIIDQQQQYISRSTNSSMILNKKIQFNTLIGANSPKECTPQSIDKIEQFLKNAREMSQNFNTKRSLNKSPLETNTKKQLIIVRDQSSDQQPSSTNIGKHSQLETMNMTMFTPKQYNSNNSPQRKLQFESQSGEKTLKSQLLKTMINSRMKLLKQTNGFSICKDKSVKGGFSDYIQQPKGVEFSITQSQVTNYPKVIKQ